MRAIGFLNSISDAGDRPLARRLRLRVARSIALLVLPVAATILVTGPAGCQETAGPAAAAPRVVRGPVYTHMCDASAAVAIDKETFIVANDEDNLLRVFRRGRGGAPIAQVDLSTFLRLEKKKPESDIEGAAWLDGRVYWITSHAPSRKAKSRPNRYRFFATRVSGDSGKITVAGEGTPYTKLIEDLAADPRMKRYQLAAAGRKAPKDKGALNIEGLCATPDKRLLFAFRNPIVDGKALVVPLENPADVARGNRPRFGDPIDWNLGGLGVRSLEYDADAGQYWIIAGPYSSGTGEFRLYRSSGEPKEQPTWTGAVDFGDLNPEALFIYPGGGEDRIQILSDDGTREVGGEPCKSLDDPAMRSFRAAVLRP
jgi:hypothetical protein